MQCFKTPSKHTKGAVHALYQCVWKFGCVKAHAAYAYSKFVDGPLHAKSIFLLLSKYTRYAMYLLCMPCLYKLKRLSLKYAHLFIKFAPRETSKF